MVRLKTVLHAARAVRMRLYLDTRYAVAAQCMKQARVNSPFCTRSALYTRRRPIRESNENKISNASLYWSVAILVT